MSSPTNRAAAIPELLETIVFNDSGLIPAIAQQHDSGAVLMMAWMNREAITETLRSGQAHYWSRSRGALWRKGESSGQTQALIDLRIDCDGDTLLMLVDQKGVACHTGRRSCFYRGVGEDGLNEIMAVETDPETLYGAGAGKDEKGG